MKETRTDDLPFDSTRNLSDQIDELYNFSVKFTTREGDIQQGPLALLWKLIESYQVDIFKVSLSKITDDFIDYIHHHAVSIEEEAEFVVMASRLVYYKSRLLLPNPGYEDDSEPDSLPFELVDQLLDYKKFQMAAESLRDMEERSHFCYVREASWGDYEKDLDYLQVDLRKFLQVFRDFLEAREKEAVVEIEPEDISIETVMMDMAQQIRNYGSLSFLQYVKLFPVFRAVVSFLAMLELARLRMVQVEQDAQFTDIILKAGQNIDQSLDLLVEQPSESKPEGNNEVNKEANAEVNQNG